MPVNLHAQLTNFIERHGRELHWLRIDSQGAWDRDDMLGELYLAVTELAQAQGAFPDIDTPADAAALLRLLRRKAGHQGRTFRNAARLDHAPADQTPLIERLVADGGEHPLSLMEAAETPEPTFDVPAARHSQLAAWHHLLVRFERRMRALADYLLISPSWCYRCRLRVQHQAMVQWPLPDTTEAAPENTLKPWRRHRYAASLRQPARQLELNLWARPAQPCAGQLWLL